MIIEDLTGKRFGRLTVMGIHPIKDNNGRKWDCLCDCGKTTIVTSYHLTHGTTQSCGCLRREAGTHHMSKTAIYGLWSNMLKRCYNSTGQAYKHYGGRGITVCDEWKGLEGFIAFYNDMGDKPEGYSLNRIDNNGPYSKENCKWSSPKEQMRNYRRNVNVEVNGEKFCFKDLCRNWHIAEGTVRQRRKDGWSIACSLMIPPSPYEFTAKKEKISMGAVERKRLNTLKY